ncbi:MAG TPA: hypothetical protein VNN62_20990 [Methylomirabilota bacterium]|jgi:hypothetical protein|nr:hypothetical protein [Methylomirabilota bacterium]
MKAELLPSFHSFMLQAPLYTSVLIVMREWREPVLTMRVQDLTPFQHAYRARVGFCTWRNAQGTWVTAIPFCLDAPGRFRIQGRPCLNPRRAADYAMMQRFAMEESVRFLFLSADLEEAEDGQIVWPPAQRMQVRQLIEQIDASFVGDKSTSAFDPDFEQARQEFEQLFTTVELAIEEERWHG